MRRILNTIFIAVGLLLILGGIGFYAYPYFGEWEHNRHVERPADIALLEQPAAARPSATPLAETATPDTSAEPAPTVTPQPTPVEPLPTVAPPTPTPTRAPVDFGLPLWMVIPSIKLDSQIVEMPNNDGYYYVPGWDIGHHADSPNPGETGNSAYAGHVSTINAGHVFARLKEVKVGNLVYVYTKTYRTDWIVTAVGTYGNKDASFLAPTKEPRITLYTCTGTFDWSTHDFSDRFVVTADLLKAGLRPKTE